MSSDTDVLARLVAYHDHIVAPPVAIADDVRRGRRRLRRRRAALVGGVALAVAAVAIAGTVVDRGRLSDVVRPDGGGPTSPVLPTRSPSPSTTAVWTGPLRPGVELLWVSPPAGEVTWPDPEDATVPGVDIASVEMGDNQPWSWGITPRTAPSPATARRAAAQELEYGLVVDGDGDRLPDCEIGIRDEASRAGVYRVWVRNLTSGEVDERVGPPYGYPVEFVHPDELRPESYMDRAMVFVFLTSTMGPCEGFTSAARYYAWAAYYDSGRVVAWDFAPDAGWLAARTASGPR